MQATVIQRIDQRLHHVLLAHEFGEVAGAPFTREDLVTHEPRFALNTDGLKRVAVRANHTPVPEIPAAAASFRT